VDGQTWVFSRRGPFCAMAVAERATRPGVVLAELDQILLTAEHDRTRGREGIRTTGSKPPADPTAAPRFRAPLHRDRERPGAIPAEAGASPAPAPAFAPQSPVAGSGQGVPRPSPEPSELSAPSPSEPKPLGEDDWEIDVVEISREFGGLYGEAPEGELEE
jgi:hypothetical protein